MRLASFPVAAAKVLRWTATPMEPMTVSGVTVTVPDPTAAIVRVDAGSTVGCTLMIGVGAGLPTGDVVATFFGAAVHAPTARPRPMIRIAFPQRFISAPVSFRSPATRVGLYECGAYVR